MSVLAMMKRNGIAFKLLFWHALTGLFYASFGNQITPADLFGPEIYALCSLGSCFSPQYGTSYCFDRRNVKPPGRYINPVTPHKTLLMRGKLIAKTEYSAIFLMYETYSVLWSFFSVKGPKCDTPFCSLEELRNADPELQGIQKGDNLCLIPLSVYVKGKSVKDRSALRAFEATDVHSGGLLDCIIANNPQIEGRYPRF